MISMVNGATFPEWPADPASVIIVSMIRRRLQRGQGPDRLRVALLNGDYLGSVRQLRI
jgi:hypothetical protein